MGTVHPPSILERTALFIDLENLVGVSSSLGLPINLQPLVEGLLQHGRLSVRRSYGDLDSACRGTANKNEIRSMLQRNLVQHEDIPHLTGHKNSADVRLAVDAISLAFAQPDISNFAILSSDRDFVPLIAKLKEMGKTIIGVGISADGTNPVYVRACDVFIYYESFFTQQAKLTGVAGTETNVGPLQGYLDLLVKAVAALDTRGIKTVGSAVMSHMRHMKPDFDLSTVGLRSLRDLVAVAEHKGLVKSSASGMDLAISLSGNALERQREPTKALSLDPDNLDAAAPIYRRILEEKLKCELPSMEERKRIYEIVDSIISLSSEEQVLTLNAISARTTETLNGEGVRTTSNSVFKVLYGLFRAARFRCEPTLNPFDPKVIRANFPISTWDAAFVRNTLNVLKRERPELTLHPGPLSTVFMGPDSDTQLIQEIINELESR